MNIPYNLQNYKPKADPEEPISDKVIELAKSKGAQCISKDGQTAYKETERGIEEAYAPNFISWWYYPNAKLPNDTIWFDKET